MRSSRPAPSPRFMGLRAFVLLSVLLLGAAGSAFPLDLQALIDKNMGGESNEKKRSPAEADVEALDNSIDPDRYYVGGGDGFQISIKDLPSQVYFPVVKSDGDLFVPDFGLIPLGRIPLSQAIQKIQTQVNASMKRNYKVYVTLRKAKTAVVTVGGAAPNPGTYRMAGTMRILDLLKLANSGNLPDPALYNLRQVRCRNGDSVKTLDLLRGLAGRGREENPYVYPGDHVEIQVIDRTICVAGEILDPVRGHIPHVPGETVGSLVSMLTFRGSADTSFLLLGQAGQPPRRVPWEAALSVVLQDNDVLTIPARKGYGQPDTVQVSGEVSRPGTYPIVRGRTTAAEILEMAGGPAASGNPKRGFVVRSSKFFVPKQKAQAKTPAPEARTFQFVNTGVRPEIAAGLNDLANSNDYSIIDFNGHPEAIPLENGDEVRIPRKEHYVYISGNVRNPGAYAYEEGEPVNHYVRKAGGYTRKADRRNVVVISRYKEVTRIKDAGRPMEGDIIMVPASIENKRLSTIYLPMVQTLATILSLGLSTYVLTR